VIKAFARLCDVIAGTSSRKGVDEYLTLLSVAETCEYRGIDFLDFLRSEERDVDMFAKRRKRIRCIEPSQRSVRNVPDRSLSYLSTDCSGSGRLAVPDAWEWSSMTCENAARRQLKFESCSCASATVSTHRCSDLPGLASQYPRGSSRILSV